MNGEQPTTVWIEHREDLVVECPVCYSTRKRCKRPSGHAASEWHAARDDAYAARCGCPGCANWLELRELRGQR